MERQIVLERLDAQRHVPDPRLERMDARRVTGDLAAERRLALPVGRDSRLEARDPRVGVTLPRGVVSERRRCAGEHENDCDRQSAHRDRVR